MPESQNTTNSQNEHSFEGGFRKSTLYNKTSQENHPLISIITVCLNSEEYIEKTIQSVINQSYNNIEYIIIDGGSRDGTVKIIRKYEHQIAYWKSEADEGISDAFNKGIINALGDVIGILNAGDWYGIDTIELLVEELMGNNDAAIFYSDLYIDDINGNTLFIKKANEKLQNKDFSYKMPAINHPTVFAKKGVYEEIGYFSKELCYAMDYEWLRRAYTKGYKFAYTGRKPFTYMIEGGTSDSNYDRTLREVYNISVSYGDNIMISYIYNIIFRTFRHKTGRQLEENTRWGSVFVKTYRKITSRFRGWEY